MSKTEVDKIVKMCNTLIMETRLTIEIEEKTKNKFKSKAAGEGKTLKEKMLELIERYLQD